MMHFDKKDIYNFYNNHIRSDGDMVTVVEELAEELKKIHDIKKLECGISCSQIYDGVHNGLYAQFDLSSKSWQVSRSDANGHYVYVGDYDRSLNKDASHYMYTYKNTRTNELFVVDSYTLRYLITHGDYQDYKFVYVGSVGNYPYIRV